MSSKILIVYYSHTGKTKQIANLIRRVTDCDEDRIIPEETYTNDPYALKTRLHREGLQARPPIKKLSHDIKEYGTVIIGTPVWNNGLPPPVLTFLEDNDWRGIKVYPFFSSGGIYAGVLSKLKEKTKGAGIAAPLYLIYDDKGKFLRLVE